MGCYITKIIEIYFAKSIETNGKNIVYLSGGGRVFPDEMKIARVFPLYKSDDRMIVNNHRPVSI